MAELCKRLPLEMVEQYRQGAYIRYVINLMKDIELHDAAHVKTIDKGGDVTWMASLSQTQVNSNYVLNFHDDAYNTDADMVDYGLMYLTLIRLLRSDQIND